MDRPILTFIGTCECVSCQRNAEWDPTWFVVFRDKRYVPREFTLTAPAELTEPPAVPGRYYRLDVTLTEEVKGGDV